MDVAIAHPSACGDVYWWHGGAHINAGRGLSVPIVYQNSPAMRHDILVIDDLAAIGLRPGRWLIRPAELHRTPSESLPRIGALPGQLLVLVQAGVRREQGDRAFERRFKPMPAGECLYGGLIPGAVPA